MKRDIERIIERLKTDVPGIHITQLEVAHPGNDDNGIWFINCPGRSETVQVESADGTCPFLIESDFNADRHSARSVEEAVSIVEQLYSIT